MAKIVDYTPKSASSEWADDAATLDGLDTGKAIVIEGKRGARTAFQRAAREAGFTARCVDTEVVKAAEGVNAKGEPVDESDYEFTFIKTDLRTHKVNVEDDADAEVADSE